MREDTGGLYEPELTLGLHQQENTREVSEVDLVRIEFLDEVDLDIRHIGREMHRWEVVNTVMVLR